MMALISFSLALSGLTGIAAAMPKHQRDLFGAPSASRQAVATRVSGWLMLVASLAAALCFWPLAIGLVGWTGLLTAASLIVALCLTYRPRALIPGVAMVLGASLLGWAVLGQLL